jgi:DNA-binding SARP family transcriptional activator
MALTLIGGFALAVDGDAVDLPVGAQRLVALLALRGRTSRSMVAGTLWPETSEHRALASLRTGIWRVNQSVDRLVTATSDTTDLRSDTVVDVRKLLVAALAMMRAGPCGSVDAVDVVFDDDGELLPGWDNEWLLADRERLRQARLHVLEARAEQLARAGRYGLALESALAALRVDSLRESAHRAVIRVHLAEGNVAEARRAFERGRQTLVRDVGVEPSAAMTGLMPAARAPIVAGASSGARSGSTFGRG